MGRPSQLNAHARPPESARALYKRYQKMGLHDINSDPDVVDIARGLNGKQQEHCVVSRTWNWKDIDLLFETFLHGQHVNSVKPTVTPTLNRSYFVYECRKIPGLYLLPSLLSSDVQLGLVKRLVHRDLSNRSYKTNVHLHYAIPYPAEEASFFTYETSSAISLLPLDPNIHKPLSMQQFLNKKLRWITLGGQYDWSKKVYPDEEPPPFPQDIATLLSGLFPNFRPEAAIVNFYSPGDTLSMHRDVSEECDNGLVSISLGCDGIFVVAAEDKEGQAGVQSVAVRLRSGDAVYMTGKARFAWHGLPQVIPNTCPNWLKDWPARERSGNGAQHNQYSQWRGWMESKRINLNVRQMRD